MTEGDRAKRASFGPNQIASGFRISRHVTAVNSDAQAEIEFDPEALAAGLVDFRGAAWVQDGPLRIGGWVTAAETKDGKLVLGIRSGAEFHEGHTTGMVVANTTASEIVYCIARLAGLPPERINIPDLRLVADRFHVVMPLRLWELGGGLRIGDVYFTTDVERMRLSLPFENAPDAVDSFLAPGRWAVARVDADNMFDAEQVGVRLIESALDRIVVEAQYSLARTPTGDLVAFARSDLFADPTADRVALVRGVATPRVWLRSLNEGTYGREARRRRLELEGPAIGESPRFDEALRAWRRAVQTTDSIAAVSALWEAIEFYAARVHSRAMFKNADLDNVRNAVASLDLNPAQRDRLAGVLAKANDSPLFAKLIQAMTIDGVPFTDGELVVMRRLRDRRNDFVHGRSREEPARDDLAVGRGFVNRLLAYWARSGRVRS